MHANNETGTPQPIAEIALITRGRGVLLHTDAAQSVGKISADVNALGVDLLTLAGHKMYAPKGVAALYVRSSVKLHPLIGGGGQDYGRRAGTENVPYASALGAAAQIATQALADGEADRLAHLRDRLATRLTELLPGRVHVHGHGHPTERLPGTLNLHIDHTIRHRLLDATPDVAASTGSACHSGNHTPLTSAHRHGPGPRRSHGHPATFPRPLDHRRRRRPGRRPARHHRLCLSWFSSLPPLARSPIESTTCRARTAEPGTAAGPEGP